MTPVMTQVVAHVPLLDLKAQYETIRSDVESALLRAAESQHFILGPEVDTLERSLAQFLQCKHAIGVSSGTDALVVALMAVDIRPGDEVIVPTYSFFATAGAVSRLNAVPIFVDIDPVTFNIDVRAVEEKITSRTRAIIPVHLYGQCADMGPLMDLAERRGLIVIEDAAQAIGAQYRDGRRAGTIGQIGCYSFFPSKNLGCFGDGGLVTTNDDVLAERLRLLRAHGSKPKYYHKLIGGNFRLDAIQAAVLNVKLPRLDGWSAKRRANAGLYTDLLSQSGLAREEATGVTNSREPIILPSAVYRECGVRDHHVYNQYVIRAKERDRLRAHLTANGIGTEVYYPVPFHRQECFASMGCIDADYPNANAAAETSIALPIYPELTAAQIEYVVVKIEQFHQR